MYQSRLVKPHIQVWPWRKLRLGPSSPGIYLVGMRHDVHRESDNTMRHIYHCLKTWIVEYEFQKEEVGGGAVSEIYNFREKWTASKSKMLIGPFRKSVWAVESISGRCRKEQRQVWVPEVTSFAKAELSWASGRYSFSSRQSPYCGQLSLPGWGTLNVLLPWSPWQWGLNRGIGE